MDYISFFLPIEEQIRYLQRTQPTVLRVGPTQLRAILHRVGYRLSAIVRPRALITSGEVFDEGLKKRIRSDLDVEMFNFYISTEFGEIASDCPEHEGLHVNADQLILECLDDADQRTEPDKPGAVVLTSLYGHTMPFIRYRLGDISALIERQCSCGSSFPLIAPPYGRQDDVIGLPSGNILSATPLFVHVNRVDGVDQYRFIQERADHIVLQLVLYEHPGEQALARMRAQLLKYLGEPVTLDIRMVDSIQDEARKFRKFISLVHQSDSRV
jgi:phenylacetate-CoA ligase